MHPDANTIKSVLKNIFEMRGDTLRLPMPRRAQLEPVIALKKLMFGDYWPVLCDFAKQEISTQEIMPRLDADPEFVKVRDKIGLQMASMTTTLMILRQQMSNAPIMTVSEGLAQLLEDTNISDDVPAKFFTVPFKTTFIEFDPAENRGNSRFFVTAAGIKSACEGCYVQERHFDVFPKISMDAINSLELDSKKPVRMIELGFAASPFNNPAIDHIEAQAAYDAIDFAGIYIQDEDEPIKEVLERHFNHYRARLDTSPSLSAEGVKEFERHFSENFTFLTKVLFYLHIERKEQRKITDASDLEARINKVAEKKRDKLRRQLNRSYDHIVIGPAAYTPISERIEVGELPKGSKKAPHFRRGTIGIRWVGTGAAKEATLVRIKESLVNRHLLDPNAVPRKNYIIK